MTEFELEQTLRSPSTATVVAAYFDPAVTAAIDAALGVSDRQVLAHTVDEHGTRRESRLVMNRQLPAFLRPLVPGGIPCKEIIRWSTADGVMTVRVQPTGRAARASILSRVSLRDDGGLVRWHHDGQVSVDLRVLGPRVERYLVTEFKRSVEVVVATTQDWLDAQADGAG